MFDSNKSGDAYFLQAFCPIKGGTVDGADQSYESATREAASLLPRGVNSPFASVANTYFGRFYVLKDVFYESHPAKVDHLKSQYLVFAAHLHGDLDPWLWDMWDQGADQFRAVFQNCVDFDSVTDASGFVGYVKRCRLKTSLPFNGSTDQPLKEQLKGLYLKQQFSKFVIANQGMPKSTLRNNFLDFVGRVEIDDLEGPTWQPGAGSLLEVEVP